MKEQPRWYLPCLFHVRKEQLTVSFSHCYSGVVSSLSCRWKWCKQWRKQSRKLEQLRLLKEALGTTDQVSGLWIALWSYMRLSSAARRTPSVLTKGGGRSWEGSVIQTLLPLFSVCKCTRSPQGWWVMYWGGGRRFIDAGNSTLGLVLVEPEFYPRRKTSFFSSCCDKEYLTKQLRSILAYSSGSLQSIKAEKAPQGNVGSGSLYICNWEVESSQKEVRV